jgi:hypothetical protein
MNKESVTLHVDVIQGQREEKVIPKDKDNKPEQTVITRKSDKLV